MADEPISEKLIDYLLTAIDGFRFERLIQALLQIRDGEQFVPLGGIHDGGADGFFRSILETQERAGHFVQISKQEDLSTKIRDTVRRLREVGREVHTVTHWTFHRAPQLDLLEDKLSRELAITLRIRDRNACLRLINHDDQTRAHFRSELRGEIYELSAHTRWPVDARTEFATDPSVFVFLQFETHERFGKGGLAVPIVDALIYWTLRETDPDKNQLMSRDEIKRRIRELLPGAASTLLPHVDSRLAVLRKL